MHKLKKEIENVSFQYEIKIQPSLDSLGMGVYIIEKCIGNFSLKQLYYNFNAKFILEVLNIAV